MYIESVLTVTMALAVEPAFLAARELRLLAARARSPYVRGIAERLVSHVSSVEQELRDSLEALLRGGGEASSDQQAIMLAKRLTLIARNAADELRQAHRLDDERTP